MNKAINRRLNTLQAFADRQRPAVVTVYLTNGTVTVTDQSGALDLLHEQGPHGEIDSFQANGLMSGWAQLLTTLLHPMENRRIEDFET